MAVSQGPPDPWPLLMEAVDLIVVAERDGDRRPAHWVGMAAAFARASFQAAKALKRDVRELYSRTARVNDRVSKLEQQQRDSLTYTDRRDDTLGRRVAFVTEQALNTRDRVDALQHLVDEIALIVDPPQEERSAPALEEAVTILQAWASGCQCERCRAIGVVIDACRSRPRPLNVVERIELYINPENLKPYTPPAGEPGQRWSQIVRTPYTVTDTQRASIPYGGPAVSSARRDALVKHLTDLLEVIDGISKTRDIEFLETRALRHVGDDLMGGGWRGDWLTEIVERQDD